MTSYVYPATITAVHDGDTFTADVELPIRSNHADIDLGFFLRVERRRLLLHISFRLYGCNAAELGTTSGNAAAENLKAVLAVGSTVTVRSHKPLVPIPADKYQPRWDADVTLADGRDLIPALIAGQWVAPWDGTGPRPVPPWPRTVAP